MPTFLSSFNWLLQIWGKKNPESKRTLLREPLVFMTLYHIIKEALQLIITVFCVTQNKRWWVSFWVWFLSRVFSGSFSLPPMFLIYSLWIWIYRTSVFHFDNLRYDIHISDSSSQGIWSDKTSLWMHPKVVGISKFSILYIWTWRKDVKLRFVYN